MRPGFDVVRTARIVRRVVDETGLDLRGLDVLTEAATGPFAATAAMAAFAGADEVVALARDSSFGSAEDAFAATAGQARTTRENRRSDAGEASAGLQARAMN